MLTTIAGNGTLGFSGDGVPATNTALNGSSGLAVDTKGNVFIADYFNNRIREVVASTGVILTVAGNGTAGYSGDGGPATSAALSGPFGVFVDKLGNIFIADTANSVIREVIAATGIIQTVATGNHRPQGVFVDNSGNVFIADTGNSRIREIVAATGVILTVAGNGTAGSSGDGGPATSAELNGPEGVWVDNSGNLFIADTFNNRIRQVAAATGVIQTIAGNGSGGFSGDGGPATSAALNIPVGVFVDGSGNIFIADSFNNRIRKVAAATGTIQTFAGNGAYSFSGDGGPATNAELYLPFGLSVDSSGNIFIADAFNNRIREVMAATGTVQTVAGVSGFGSPGYVPGDFGGDGGLATGAQLNEPAGVFVDSSRNVFIADSCNNRIREVAAATGDITTVAGNGASGPSGCNFGGFGGDGGQARSAQLNIPTGIFVDGLGNIYFADSFNDRIRKVTASTGVIQTVAVGRPPEAVFVDGFGNIFIANTGGNVIQEVVAATGVIQTVAGSGLAGFSGDGGPATGAELNGPFGVLVDSSGNIFIADTGNNRIREVIAATGVIQTVAGNGTSGFTGDGGLATSAELAMPLGLGADQLGNLYVADANNNRIRKITGLASVAAAHLSTTTVAFPPQVVGTKSQVQTIMLSNAGNTALSIGSIAATGTNSSDFAAQSTCGLTLPPATNCSIQVTFTPSTLGPRVAALTITDNGLFGSPQVVSLSGTGTSAVGLSLSPSSLFFGAQLLATPSAARAVTLTNSSGGALSITSIAIAGANSGDFSLSHNCPPSLAVNTSCVIQPTFKPTAAGPRKSSISISDNSGSGVQTIILTGVGAAISAAPSSLTFSGQQVGTPSTAQAVTITNEGGTAVNLWQITFVGANAGDFSKSNTSTCGSSLGAGANCAVNVIFTPAAAGSRTTSLFISDDGGGSPQAVTLTGTGTSGSAARLSSSVVVFGEQAVGTSSHGEMVVLTNAGDRPLAVGSMTVAGASGRDFVQTNTCGSSLAAGASCTIEIRFTPRAMGTRTAVINVPRSGNLPLKVQGTGIGRGPRLIRETE